MKKFTESLLFTEADSIHAICAPLKFLGIKGFFYQKVYVDGSFIDFSSGIDWTEQLFTKLYEQSYNPTEIFNNLFIKEGVSLWEMNPHNQIWKDGREIFGVGNGITLCLASTPEFVESCSFYSSANDYQINDFYLNNLDLLKNFAMYFKDRAMDLIKKEEKKRLFIPDYYLPKGTNRKAQSIDSKEFLSFIQTNRFFVDQDIYLTLKEGECLNWLIKGKTAEEIGMILNISKRTVETHFTNIKNKTQLYSKADLIRFAIKSGIINFFE